MQGETSQYNAELGQQQPTKNPSRGFTGSESIVMASLAAGEAPLALGVGLFKMKYLEYGCFFLVRIIYPEAVKINRPL